MWLAAEIWYSDGRNKRFGGDEADPRDDVSNISWNTQIPGGYDTASLALQRPPNLPADEAKLFSHVRIYGPGNQTFYEGRVTGVPQVGAQEINLETEGWVAALADNEYFERLYLDADLSKWTQPSTARKAALISAAKLTDSGGPLQDRTTGEPALSTVMVATWAGATRNEWWYNGRLPITSLYYAWKRAPATPGTFTNLTWQAGLDTTGNASTLGDVTASLAAAGPGSGTLTATSTDRKFAMASVRASGSSSTLSGPPADGDEVGVYWTQLVVVGDHGLTQATLANGAPALSASDIIADAVALAAPQLTFTTGSTGSIEQSAVLIPHAVYHETTARDVIEEMTKRGATFTFLPDWGVYDNKEFFWRSPGSYGRQWHVSREDVTPSYSGPDMGERIKRVVVTYQDVLGVTRSVGSTYSGADVEFSELDVADSLSTKTKHVDIGVGYQDQALVIGQLVLSEQNRLIQRGSISLSGDVRDITGAPHPVAAIRAGDRITVQEDMGDPVPISNTTYDHDSLTLTADLGGPSHSSEALFAQLEA